MHIYTHAYMKHFSKSKMILKLQVYFEPILSFDVVYSVDFHFQL